MDIWKILEINPTTDIALIKKAYAQKLKVYHPEDDALGFQMLRESYDNAINYAKNYQSQSNDIILSHFTDSEGDQQKQISDDKVIVNDLSLNEDITLIMRRKLFKEFFDKLQNLYGNFFNRIEVKSWEVLLDDVISCDLETQEALVNLILEFLSEHRNLPREVWRYLNSIFHWDEREEQLYMTYSKTFVYYLILQFKEIRMPRYCYFRNIDEINIEEYLNNRGAAFMALQERDIKKAEQLILKAFEIYQNDPDLYCIKGELYYQKGDVYRGNYEFHNALKLEPKDLYIYYYKAQAQYDNENYDDAFQTCYTIVARSRKYPDIKMLAGRCLYYCNKWLDASRVFIQILKKQPTDYWTKNYLELINERLLFHISKQPISVRYIIRLKRNYQVLGVESDDIKLLMQQAVRKIGALMMLILSPLYFIAFLIGLGTLNYVFLTVGGVLTMGFIMVARKKYIKD